MENYKIFCGGNFIATSKRLDVINPFSQKIFATTYLADTSHLEIAILAAESIKQKLRKMPSYKKYEALMFISSQLTENIDSLAELLAKESGKPIIYARAEIMRSATTFMIAAEESKRLPGELLSLDWTPAGMGKQGIIKHFPVGLVAGIAPFNFPMNLAVHKIAPALAAGCPIVLKPSSNTPLSTLALAKIIAKSEFPKGSVSILPLDRTHGNQLVTDDRFKLLSFTGSPSVGWKMKSQAGSKKVVLELGGNAGLIITKSADLDKAVKQAVLGGFAYSGQVCIHAQRIYVAQEIFTEFSKRFVAAVRELRIGDPLDSSTQISAMIDEPNALRIESWVNEAIADGAKILVGGKRDGSLYLPTVLVNTKARMKVCALEVFGPVVTLEPFDDFESAVASVNESEFGLQAGIFTNDIGEMDYAFEQLEVGGVVLNDSPSFRVDHMPYGGIKNSGLGREGVKYAMMDMLEAKVLIR